jgi:hypothetical protein
MKNGICRKIVITGGKHVKQSKPCSEGQMSHVLSYAESRPKIDREIYITMTLIEEISREGDEEGMRERKQMTRLGKFENASCI